MTLPPVTLPYTLSVPSNNQGYDAVGEQTRTNEFGQLSPSFARTARPKENMCFTWPSSNTQRLDFLSHIVAEYFAHDVTVPAQAVHQIWHKLFKDDAEVDEIWALWADGDEAQIASLNISRHPYTTLLYLPDAYALSRRPRGIETSDNHAATHEQDRRRRIQQGHSYTRLSAIAWLVINSKTMRNSDESRGFNVREIWDLEFMIDRWHTSIKTVSGYMRNTNSFDYRRDTSLFDSNMNAHGHTCHSHFRRSKGDALDDWLNMRSFLNPEQRHDVICLSLSTNSLCRPCAVRAKLVPPPASTLPFTPARHLVLIWCLWGCEINGYSWLTNLENAVSQNQSTLFNSSMLESIDTQLCKLALGTQHEKWTPWANSFPDPLRRAFASRPIIKWTRVHTHFQKLQSASSSSNIPDASKSVNLWSWIGAVTMLQAREDQINRASFRRMMDSATSETKELLDMLPAFEEEPFVNEFRRSLQESHHTCYKFKHWSWYASALWLVIGCNQQTWMSKMKSKSCAMCRVTLHLEIFMNIGKRRAAPPKPQERLDSLLQEIARYASQRGLRLELPMSGTTTHSSLALPALPAGGQDMPRGNDTQMAGANIDSDSPAGVPVDRGNDIYMPDAGNGTCSVAGEPDNRAMSGTSARSQTRKVNKGCMVKTIKAHLIQLLEDAGVTIGGTKSSKLLPWTTLRKLLEERGLELDGWPTDVPLPGSGSQSCDDNKGINGLSYPQLHLLCKAVESNTAPLALRRIAVAESPTPGGHDLMATASNIAEDGHMHDVVLSGAMPTTPDFTAEHLSDGSTHIHAPRIRRRDGQDDTGQSARKKRNTQHSLAQ